MTTINYEIDQAESITQANDAKSLSDQVIKLRNLEDKIVLAENKDIPFVTRQMIEKGR